MPLRFVVVGLAVALAVQTVDPAAAQQTTTLRPLAPVPPDGLPVSPFMDGWYENPDGTYTISFGYYNRNAEDVIELAIGDANAIEPAEFNGKQPTTFLPGRHRGVFAVTIPAEMRDTDVVWTLRNGGETFSVPGRARSFSYDLDYAPRAQGTEMPLIQLEAAGPEARGRDALTSEEPLSANVGEPLALTVWAIDPSERPQDDFRNRDIPVTLTWFKHQGPGDVTFARIESDSEGDGAQAVSLDGDADDEEGDLTANQVPLGIGGGKGTINATFSEPGEYLLRVRADNFTARDSSPGQQCCWSNAFVKVTVAPGS